MQRMLSPLPILLACSVILLAPAAFAQCVSGSITSELETSGPFAGLWKYTLEITWDVQQGLSNVVIECGAECERAMCDAAWAFADTSGTGDGVTNDETSTPGDCVVPFAGAFDCFGGPLHGLGGPTVKWDALDSPDCEPGTTGSATLCFWVDLPPDPDSEAPIVLIKSGQNVCEGMIMGDCPTCPVGVESIDWSEVKVQFKRNTDKEDER
jgi:hypothetical protein